MSSSDLLSKISDVLAPLSSLLGGEGSAVGLSIGTSAIKLVELKKTGRNWKLIHFGIAHLPEDAIVNREIVNPVVVVDSIKTLISQIKLKTKSVCSSISGPSLIVKKMNLEVPNIKELQDQVFWEAEQYIPFDISEVVMDYHVLSQSKDNRVEVVLVAVKKDVLESYMSSIQQATLKPKIIDVDFFALQNLFESNYSSSPSEATALVDIGASATKMVIVQNGMPLLTKESNLGGRNLTSEIQRNLNLSYADAEVLKTGSQGVPMPQEVSDLMQIMAENLAVEIKRSIDLYHASSAGAPVSSVFLSGGSSLIPELTRFVADSVGVPTQLINPFNAISYDPAVFTADSLHSIAPLAAIPIGLALRMGGR